MGKKGAKNEPLKNIVLHADSIEWMGWLFSDLAWTVFIGSELKTSVI